VEGPVNAVINFEFHKILRINLVAAQLVARRLVLSSIDLVV
jgi:hypothetical protein